ncbi:MAG: rod shape-determining protein RodA [Candidatus Doudnabacteria bacterium]|nr:rod shape-determining protein RodA [Candidatus Doudnabacteria bacterium]
MFNWAKIKHQDWVLTGLIVALTAIGLLCVFSTTYTQKNPVSADLLQQIGFFVIGFFLFNLIITLDRRLLGDSRILILISVVTILSLLLVLAAGEVVFGTKRWFNIGDFSLQPSEFAKISLILLVSGAFALAKNNYAKLPDLRKKLPQMEMWRQWVKALQLNHKLIIAATSTFAILTLVWLQPSLGNTLIMLLLVCLTLLSLVPNQKLLWLGAIVLSLNFIATANIISLDSFYNIVPVRISLGELDLTLIAITTFISILVGRFARIKPIVLVVIIFFGLTAGLSAEWGWNNALTSYQRERVLAYLNPTSDPLGAYWQVNQAQIAIGSGQILGKGLLQGTQSNLGLLPFAYTDFIYAAFAEQFGFIGCAVLLGLFYLLISRIMYIAGRTGDLWGKLVCIGVAAMLTLNIAINVGMNLGLMPVTGVPLPLISYGGSAVLANLIGLGLVQLVHANLPIARPGLLT